MKDGLVKILPYVFGFTFGWLLVHPPEWFRSLGALGYLFLGFLCILAFVSFITLLILANLPAEVEMTADYGASTAGLDGYIAHLTALGFVPAGPPLRVKIAPPAGAVAS